MNCSTCRSHLSDFMEKSLPEGVREMTRAHLEACMSCQRELRELRAAVRLLRDTPPEDPPPDLESGILARLESATGSPGAKDEHAVRTRPEIRRSQKIRTLRRGRTRSLAGSLAAAAVIVAALVGYTVGRNSSLDDLVERFESDLASSRSLARSLEDELDRLEKTAERRKEEQQARIDRLLTELGTSQKKSEGQFREERSLRQRTETRLEQLEALVDGQQREFALLRGESEEMRDELERLRAVVAEREVPVSPSPRGELEPAPEASGALARATRRASVTVRRVGDQYELQIAGPRDNVIPRLIELAKSEDDLRLRRLALGTLENLLPLSDAPPEEGRREEGQAAGFFANLERNFAGLTGSEGLILAEEDAPAEPDHPETLFRKRLARAERCWQQLSAGRAGP